MWFLKVLFYFDELIFTSPVAVEAFFEIYDDIVPSIEVHAMGMMTRCKLKGYLDASAKKIDKKQLVW